MFFKKESCKKIALVTIFAIALAFLETVVVIYLRKLYYPKGFEFPLITTIEPSILNIEWVREFFTIVMLACIGILAGKKIYGKLAYFLYAFAIWDIFYYIWLKIILNWPSSLFTLDLLFLIPVPWTAPVLAPLIVSLDMILFSLLIIYLQDKGFKIKINFLQKSLLIFGCLIIIYTFLYDYSAIIIRGKFLSDFLNLTRNKEFLSIISTYLPKAYKWGIFIIGEVLILFGISLFYFRNRNKKTREKR